MASGVVLRFLQNAPVFVFLVNQAKRDCTGGAHGHAIWACASGQIHHREFPQIRDWQTSIIRRIRQHEEHLRSTWISGPALLDLGPNRLGCNARAPVSRRRL